MLHWLETDLLKYLMESCSLWDYKTATSDNMMIKSKRSELQTQKSKDFIHLNGQKCPFVKGGR